MLREVQVVEGLEAGPVASKEELRSMIDDLISDSSVSSIEIFTRGSAILNHAFDFYVDDVATLMQIDELRTMLRPFEPVFTTPGLK